MMLSLRPILAALGVVLFVASAQADIPKLISIQGRLTDSTGTPLDSTVSLTITVYGDAAGTSVLFTEDHSAVNVAGGLFELLIGSIGTLPDSVFTGAPRWMGIGFTGGPSIQSPLPVASVAYAIKSGTADTAKYALSAPSGTGGWTDDGNVVRLSLVDDSVGIGTDSPQTKLHIIGDLRVEGKALIGVASDNPGNYAFAAGESNVASGNFSTIGGGQNNVAESDYSSVGGGILDSAAGTYATVSGGLQNRAAGSGSAVGGGAYNDANGPLSTIAGGTHNLTTGLSATVSGGDSNSAIGYFAGALSGYGNRAGATAMDTGNVIAGGFKNTIQNRYSAIGGGGENQIVGFYSSIAGGFQNFAAGEGNVIGGGRTNLTDNDFSTIGGGLDNYAEADFSTIAGGRGNWVGSQYSTISGGRDHFMAAAFSTIPGGYADTVAGTAHYSYLFGIGSKLTQDSTFMVDMPHFWIGKEATGWQLTNSRGTIGQVLASDGAGGSSWQDASGGGGGWIDDGAVVRLQTASDKVGIGTNTPEFKLSLDGDGGILAKGMLGQGDTLTESGFGSKLIWYPRKAAFRAGYVQTTRWDDVNIGTSSVALGFNGRASGDYSVALGYDPSALGDNAIAMGWNSDAQGAHSVAIGYESHALLGHALGIGWRAHAHGLSSIAIGEYVLADAENAIVIGSGRGISSPLRNGAANSLGIGVNRTVPPVHLTESRFHVNFGNSSTFPQFYVDTNGVGIGMNAPRCALDVLDVARVKGDTWPTAGEGMEFGYDYANDLGLIQVFDRGSYTWGKLYLGDGLVGVGTLSPLALTHVSNSVGKNRHALLVENYQNNYNAIRAVILGSGTAVYAESNAASSRAIWARSYGNNGVAILASVTDSGLAAISATGDVNVDGTVNTDILTITGGSDLSERFDIQCQTPQSDVLPGMLVCIDPDNPGKLMISSEGYDKRVAGIIAGAGGLAPGMLMSQKGSVADGDYPVALSGRVYCYADAEDEPIAPGDLLTTSASNPGHAMKVTEYDRAHGAVIGKSMTPLTDGTGLILVLVNLQ